MKSQFITLTAIAIFATAIIFSCKKKDTTTPEEPAAPTTTGGTTTGGAVSFTWTENAGPTLTADSAFWTTWGSGTGVRAFKGGYANFFEINWGTTNNTSVGAKPLAISDVTFLKGSSTYTNNAASNLNVTAFASNQLSGNFAIAVSGGSVTSINAGFNALPKK